MIETVGKTVGEGLELLSKVGLNDAFLFLRTYDQLSDGQKYRYRIAKPIESGKQWWLMDEFAPTLDRDTAKIVAFNLQKLARQQGRAVIAATTHTDLQGDLNPSVHVHKRFGEEISIKYYPSFRNSPCSLVQEMQVKPGTLSDWKKLGGFHYRSHSVGAVRRIFCLWRGPELCGVIVYAYPGLRCARRKLVLHGTDIKKLNRELSTIQRVVVHPKYRTIGLGAKLIRDTLALAGTRCVEMSAVMGKYNPFAERAGMIKVYEQLPDPKAVRVSEALELLGFNLQFLGSQNYVLGKLGTLSPELLSELKNVFYNENHPRFLREIATDSSRPYGTKKEYARLLEKADNEKIAKLIKITGILLQTKAYLFWGNVKMASVKVALPRS